MIKSAKRFTRDKGTSELEPVQNFQTGPVRPVTGRSKKTFQTGKNRQNSAKNYRYIRSFTIR
jgi:hypothetical protein